MTIGRGREIEQKLCRFSTRFCFPSFLRWSRPGEISRKLEGERNFTKVGILCYWMMGNRGMIISNFELQAFLNLKFGILDYSRLSHKSQSPPWGRMQSLQCLLQVTVLTNQIPSYQFANMYTLYLNFKSNSNVTFEPSLKSSSSHCGFIGNNAQFQMTGFFSFFYLSKASEQ